MKNGFTSAGRARWRCSCGASQVRPRKDRAELAQFTRFLTYLSGTASQASISGNSGRTFRRQIQWCWHVPTPYPPVTGEIHQQVFIDGIYLPHQWCLLLARSTSHVISWQWCRRENSASYRALLTRLAPPDLVATDGHGGALRALDGLWPHVPIQRCLLHIHRNNLRDLTRNPQTQAGKALLGLSRQLLRLTTADQAANWSALLVQFHTEYGAVLKERTHQAHNVSHSGGRQWWYTHLRDRRVYHRLARLQRGGTLFAYLAFNPPRERTTNPVESVNARIRSLVQHHRGMSEDHMIAMIDWHLYQHTETPLPPAQVLANWTTAGRPTRKTIPTKQDPPAKPEGPEEYGTAYTAEEGLWARTGWAGRSN